ncbi:CDP-diacylglycerol pyrophosphatase [Minicystis rosea]|nr:CDP-diacylglycerol pyrophosphatase [Minicystis rosea]
MKKDSLVHRASGRWGRVAALIGTALTLTAVVITARGGPPHHCDYGTDRTCLWQKVVACKSDPSQCAYVNLAQQFVVIADAHHKSHVLTVPTMRVTGIEDPQVQAPSFNFWDHAWDQAKRYVQRPKEHMGLAINCEPCREQDQLHIHAACVKREVRETLEKRAHEIKPSWGGVSLTFGGHSFDTRRLGKNEIYKTSPFQLLRDKPQAWHHMGQHTLAVIGQKDESFIALDSFDRAHAEDLLDLDCTNP